MHIEYNQKLIMKTNLQYNFKINHLIFLKLHILLN
jgi:hypothetical protein